MTDRPDVAGMAMTKQSVKHRAMPVVVGGEVLVVRPEPETASGAPLNHAEKTLHAMADRIEALEAVVEAARDCADKEHLENRVALAAARTGAPIITARIPAKLWNPVLKALAALGDGDG